MICGSGDVGDEPGTKAGGDNVDEDEDGDFQDDRHLQALKRKRWQPPSSEPLRSAAAGPRAHATSMDDLTLDVYPLIFAHLPMHSGARLALVSTAWNAAFVQLLQQYPRPRSPERIMLPDGTFLDEIDWWE